MTLLTISQLAKKANVNLTTIRYYERCGLIAKPKRSSSGYRLYSDDFIVHIRFIAKAKRLGFTLEEIAELFNLQSHSDMSCEVVKDCMAEKIQFIEDKIQFLSKLKIALIQLDSRCECSDEKLIKDCLILKSLISE